MTKDGDIEKDNSFEAVLADLFVVYQKADTETGILTSSVIPKKFHEPNGDEILSSYRDFVKSQRRVENTDITTKFNNNEYTQSPYKLYHDIKVAASKLIQDHEIGTKAYQDIDFFYKFSTELLLRELGRIHILLDSEKTNDDIEPTELESQLKEDFNKVVTTYNLSNGEVVTYLSKTSEPEPSTASPYATVYNQTQPQPVKQTTQPLFSSLIPKSDVDTTPTVVDEPFSVSKVVPLIKNQSRAISTIDTLSPANTKIPSPLDQQSSEILHDFFHPIWYTLPVPTWLIYKSNNLKPANLLPQQLQIDAPTEAQSALATESTNKSKLTILQQRGTDSESLSAVPTLVRAPGDSFRSFAPRVDSRDAIISDEFKGKVWLNHIGFEQIQYLRAAYLKSIEPVIEASVSPTVAITEEDKKDEVKTSTEETKEITKNGEPLEKDINIAHLVNWDPEKIEHFKAIKQERAEITSPRSLQRLISTNILKLNKLRQERYLRSDIRNTLPASVDEVRTYNKIVKLISLAIQLYKINPGDFSIEFSKKLPVLTSEYNGVMPGVPPSRLGAGGVQQSSNSTNKSGRLPSIRGPYKKKNRF
ncbi:uncharacterized protein RJT20DRAFT_130906 [Scheffersomyces xylosifermentans]|uniref:uncharacterized protein n=1 Tax=Scheffersomyces xylosifermentans TaxID=1304137 RepID=UPI00315CDF5E